MVPAEHRAGKAEGAVESFPAIDGGGQGPTGAPSRNPGPGRERGYGDSRSCGKKIPIRAAAGRGLG